ncbi:MAG: hypothetical protein AMXMBFR58_24330 [Phycisphaerae bacterium]
MSTPHSSRELSLAGPRWQICPDPLNRGMSERWGEAPPLADEPWVTAAVPGTIQHSLGPDFRGVAWYRLHFELPRDWLSLTPDERLRVRFDCAATDARVWINGRYIGRHLGDFIPFEFEATQAMLGRRGEVELVVRIDQVNAPRPAKGVITEHGHIGKGFHDVLSVQHAGLWGDVRLRRTGPVTIRPNGIAMRTHATEPALDIEFDGPCNDEILTFSIVDEQNNAVAGGVIELEPGATTARYEWKGEQALSTPLEPWSPRTPAMYTLLVDITPRHRAGHVYESHAVRFAHRTVSLGGPGDRRVLLNGDPIQLRGVLHWGHEPIHIAPAPTPAQVRAEFAELKLRGFNCICLCMVYMPEHYYEIADEMGMLLWQEHPVWKAPMGDELLPEYQRLFAEYFRRDRRHPSVILVSGSCEHEMFNPRLADRWWKTAGRELPGTLKQVQTAFFAWADPAQTDLYDEHTYDNSGRWIDYLPDVRAAIDALPDPHKPFIMGETVISNAWPDVAALKAEQQRHSDASVPVNRPAAVGNAPSAAPWWMTRGLDECAAVERDIAARWGDATLGRFRQQAHRHNLNLRKFQCEMLRLDPDIAGWVMNHIRDVPGCRCGFMDDLDRWRYEPFELRAFLSDAALLLETPGHLRGFAAGETLRGRLHLCNFSSGEIDTRARLSVLVGGRTMHEEQLPLIAGRGQVVSAPVTLGRFEIDRPTPVVIRAESEGVPENEWTVWLLPRQPGQAVLVHTAVSFTDQELAPDFEERKYSSGWGLPCRTWKPVPMVPAELFPESPAWSPGRAGPADVVVSHRLTRELLAHCESGGRALLLGSRADGGMNARTVMQWAGVPLVIESEDAAAPVPRGVGTCIIDLLHMDLARHTQRMIPTQELGLAAAINPIIRFIHTHDSGKPTIYDALFSVKMGAGLLAVSTLDHRTPAGQWLLQRVVHWLGRAAPPASGGGVDLARFATDG